MRRDQSGSNHRAVVAFASMIAVAIAVVASGCTATDCAPDAASSTITVHAVKPGVAAVQCWSGCAPGVRELQSAGDDEWRVQLADDRPETVTLAARDAEGGLLFGQRFRLEWSGCPAAPTRTELELFEPEGGTQPSPSG
jgi:hypothetical protein